jgi:hypothetical protein
MVQRSSKVSIRSNTVACTSLISTRRSVVPPAIPSASSFQTRRGVLSVARVERTRRNSAAIHRQHDAPRDRTSGDVNGKSIPFKEASSVPITAYGPGHRFVRSLSTAPHLRHPSRPFRSPVQEVLCPLEILATLHELPRHRALLRRNRRHQPPSSPSPSWTKRR